ncbi:MAG: tRNA pseudouridine(13) synthase TruD [Thermofilaceae archaeon]
MPFPTRSELDKELGMLFYITQHAGIGGILKEKAEDFIVTELVSGGLLCTSPEIREWGGGVGEYTWFLFEKRSVDTITALRLIAKALRINYKTLAVMGLKDARALTFQLACVKGVNPENFPSHVGKYVRVLAAFRMPFKLTSNILYGNYFEIKVKELALSKNETIYRISELWEEIKDAGGVPNYFGYQRFGTIRPVTHIVGKCILKGMFKEAVCELLTRVFPYESDQAKEARKYLASTWDLKGVLKLLPNNLHHERMIIQYLIKHPGDYFGALRTLPLQVRRLFVEAFQAYIFNRVLSRRLEEGMPISKAIAGDLVALYGASSTSILRANSSNLDKLNQLISLGSARVVMNVIGYATVLSDGAPGELEKEVLKEEEVSIENFRIRHMSETSSRGSTRPLALKPENLKVSMMDLESGPVATFSFALQKGMYATILLREFVKPENPALQGF